MDDEVERLERALRQAPEDGGLAARLKAALLRAGRRDELTRRYRLGFVCDVRWGDMAPTPDAAVRRCDVCRRAVHAADTYADFDRLAAAGHCVAVEPRALPGVLDGLVDDPARPPARSPGDPCLVERVSTISPVQDPSMQRTAGSPVRVPVPGRGLLARLLERFGR